MIFGLWVAIATGLHAQAVFVPRHSDSSITISGMLSADSVLTGSVRLEVSGGSVSSVGFLPSDLQQEGAASRFVSRRALEIVGSRTLADGIPTELSLKLTLPRATAQYKGSLTFRLPGSAARSELILPLTVQAQAVPALLPQAGSDTIRLRLVGCGSALSCAPSAILLPDAALLDSLPLTLSNPTADPTTITRALVNGVGSQPGNRMAPNSLTLARPRLALAGHSVGSDQLRINRGVLSPDHYHGSLYLTLSDDAGLLTLPVDIAVRANAWLPLFLLFSGILLGRLAKFMTEKGNAQSLALAMVYREETECRRGDPSDVALLIPMLDEVRHSVYQMALGDIATKVAAIATRRSILTQLRQLEAHLDPRVPAEGALIAQIVTIRAQVAQCQDAAALAALASLRQAIENLPAPAAGRVAGVRTMVSIAQKLARLGIVDSRSTARIKAVVGSIAGIDGGLRAELTLWLVRPLLAITLLVLLLAVGMNTLYVQNGVTFGANAFGDCLGMLLWGLSADVASRTLGNLGGPIGAPP